MNKQQISEINSYYQRAAGKHYQMFGGFMVTLQDYKDRTLCFELTISDRWDKRDALSTAFQLARELREFIPALKDAMLFESRCVYLPPGQPIGFVFRVTRDIERLADQVADAVSQMNPAEEFDPTQRTVVVSGLIDADIPCDMSPNRKFSGLPLNYDKNAKLN